MAKSNKSSQSKTGKKDVVIEDAYKEALGMFGHRSNITGIDIGYKYKDGEKTNERSIRLHVKEKLPASALESAEIFPEKIKGFPIDVIQANYKADLQPAASAIELIDRTQRFGRIQPGISIGHKNVSAGTLGLIVKDNKTGRPAILSNWHVLAGDNSAVPGDEITQPGRHDGGRVPRDIIARLERMIIDKDGDAAVALITNDRPFDSAILDLNIIPDGLGDPEDGDVVVKSGRTTEVTRGRVDGKGRYFIDYSIGRIGIDGFRITTIEADNPNNVEISKGGDSGSAWMLDNTNTMVGLHFAGETDPSPEEEHAIACFAKTVFSRLSISLLDGVEASEIFHLKKPSNTSFSQAGNMTISNIFERLDPREIRLWAKLLERNYPRLVSDERLTEELQNAVIPELGALGVVTIGFAVGAASKLINNSNGNNNALSPEAFSLVVSAFISGAIAGTRAVEGKL